VFSTTVNDEDCPVSDVYNVVPNPGLILSPEYEYAPVAIALGMLTDALAPAHGVPEGHTVNAWKSALPPGPPAGAVTVHVVSFVQLPVTVLEMPAPGMEIVNEVVAVGVCLKPVPVIVSVFPPAEEPLAGLTDAIVGVAGVVPFRKYAVPNPPGVPTAIEYAP
jgi:hypothetical protein